MFVRCRLDRRDGRSALIEAAHWWPRTVELPLDRISGRLVMAARTFADVVSFLVAEAGIVHRLVTRAWAAPIGVRGIVYGRRPRPSAEIVGRLLAAAGKPWAWPDQGWGRRGCRPPAQVQGRRPVVAPSRTGDPQVADCKSPRTRDFFRGP